MNEELVLAPAVPAGLAVGSAGPDPSDAHTSLGVRLVAPVSPRPSAMVMGAIGVVAVVYALAAALTAGVAAIGIAVPSWMAAVLIGAVVVASIAVLVAIGVRHLRACRAPSLRRSTYDTVNVNLQRDGSR